jgi:hypothetical protein
MPALNKTYIIGAIAFIESRKDADGAAIAVLDITADSDRIRVFATGRVADYLAKHAAIGDPLAVECSLRPGAAGLGVFIDRVLWIRKSTTETSTQATTE